MTWMISFPSRRPSWTEDAQETSTMMWHLVLRKFDEPVPENDLHWIYSDQVGGPCDPQRHQIEQKVLRLLLNSLKPGLRTPAADVFIQRAIAAAGGCLYRDALMLVWPLLSCDDRFQLQQWYQSYKTSRTELPASSRPAVEQPEPARGSRDPAPEP